MTGSIALDVVIGLTFIFLLYSLLATTIQEIIATSFGFRAKVLEKAILRMLEDGKVTTSTKLGDRVSGLLHLFGKKVDYKDKLVAASFYSHPLIKYLAEDNYHSKPTYINAQNFSKVMLDLLNGIDEGKLKDISEISRNLQDGRIKTEIIATVTKDGKKHPLRSIQCSFKTSGNADSTIPAINEETQLYLKSLLADARYDVDKFRAQLEGWFDTTMERATGWYKRYVQLILLIIGLGIAALFNVDTIAIARKLATDPKAREGMVQAANTYMKEENGLRERIAEIRNNPARLPSDTVELTQKLNLKIEESKELKQEIDKVNGILGLGWDNPGRPWYHGIVGWLITALAISLGAPFWFDLLSKLMKLRGAGGKTSAEAGGASTPQPGTPAPVQVITNTSNESSEEAVG